MVEVAARKTAEHRFHPPLDTSMAAPVDRSSTA
jgi:hypothetical protein